MHLSKLLFMQLSTNSAAPEGVGGATGGGGGIGAVGTGARGGLFLSSFRLRLRLELTISSALEVPRALLAETFDASKTANARNKANLFLNIFDSIERLDCSIKLQWNDDHVSPVAIRKWQRHRRINK